jgi:hypothetical protein
MPRPDDRAFAKGRRDQHEQGGGLLPSRRGNPVTMSEPNGNGTDSGRNNLGRFMPGHKSIGGRKPGVRNKLSESFLADLHAEWKKSGKKVLARVAETEPATFLKCVSSVLPRVMEVDGILTTTHRTELAIEVQDFATAYQQWGKAIGANMPMIESQTIDEAIENDDDEQPSTE